MSVHHTLDAESGDVGEAFRGGEGGSAQAFDGSCCDGLGDGVFGGVLDGSGQSQDVVSSVPSAVWTARSVILPVVTVPVLSRTMVSTWRV
ncbi:hypothetical protein, partial [Streptomyces sp. CBG30]|uniref:hypothetical protein n=1 Tax=Streptomyces sp. CBG30 TaxID=2838869 RepID=UPI0035ADC73D